MTTSDLLCARLDLECEKIRKRDPSDPFKAVLTPSQAKNVPATLKVVQALGRGADLLNPEALDDLRDAVAAAVLAKGKSAATAATARSHVRYLSELACSIASNEELPTETPDVTGTSLAQAIRTVFQSRWPKRLLKDCIADVAIDFERFAKPGDYPPVRGNTKADLSQRAGRLAYLESRLTSWVMYERQPQASARPLLGVLERVLFLDAGQLTHKVAMPRSELQETYRQNVQRKKAARDAMGDEERDELEAMEEALASFQLPQHVQAQLDALVATRMGSRPPALHLASFPLKKKEALDLEFNPWTVDGFGRCATAELYRTQVTYYLRWLHFEHGVPLEDLDLSLLLQDEIMELYIEHCSQRDVYHSVAHLLNFNAAMAKPVVGYLSRYHVPTQPFRYTSEALDDLAQEGGLLRFETLDSWRSYEPILYRRLSQLGDRAVEGVELLDGKRNVAWITNYKAENGGIEGGIAELWKAIDGLMEQARLAGSDRNAFANACVAAWLALELRTPLRVKNTEEMELIAEPAAHTLPKRPSFWQDSDGHYCVYVPKQFLKNGRFANTGHVAVRAKILAGTRSHAVITEYLQIRARRLGSTPSAYLFCMFQNDKVLGQKRDHSLGGLIIKRTERAFRGYLDCTALGIKNGLNPHGMRHIVAQRILAKEPNNYRKAATALMDSIAMVMRVYGDNAHDQNADELDTDFAF